MIKLFLFFLIWLIIWHILFTIADDLDWWFRRRGEIKRALQRFKKATKDN